MLDTPQRTIVKEVENARLYSDGSIFIKNVRLSYPWLFKMSPARKNKDGSMTKPSYGAVFLMPKDTHPEAKKLLVRVIKDILKENNKGVNIPAERKFLRDGDPKVDEDGDAEPGKPEEAGMWKISTRESKRPILLSNKKDPKTGKARRLSPESPADCDMIYGGCWVNALIRPWWQSNEGGYGLRVNCGVSMVQFKRDDTPFGAGRLSDEVVDQIVDGEVEDGEEDADDGDDL